MAHCIYRPTRSGRARIINNFNQFNLIYRPTRSGRAASSLHSSSPSGAVSAACEPHGHSCCACLKWTPCNLTSGGTRERPGASYWGVPFAASPSHSIVSSLPFCQNGAKSGFEMWSKRVSNPVYRSLNRFCFYLIFFQFFFNFFTGLSVQLENRSRRPLLALYSQPHMTKMMCICYQTPLGVSLQISATHQRNRLTSQPRKPID